MAAVTVNVGKFDHVPIVGGTYTPEQSELIEKIKTICSSVKQCVSDMPDLPTEIWDLYEVTTFLEVKNKRTHETKKLGEIANALNQIGTWFLKRDVVLLMGAVENKDYSELLKNKQKTEQMADRFPSWFANLNVEFKNRKEIDLSNKGMTSLPVQIGFFTEVEELNLNNNRIENLPYAVADLKKLEALYLSYNFLTSIPSFIKDLPHLQELDVTHNNGLNEFFIFVKIKV